MHVHLQSLQVMLVYRSHRVKVKVIRTNSVSVYVFADGLPLTER